MKKLTQIIVSATLAIFVLGSAHAEQNISQGDWSGIGYAINGGWKLIERENKNFIVFDENFSTKSGPDLKVFLSKKPIAKLSGKNVVSTSVKLAELQSNSGIQEYEIPGDINLSDFTSVVIHCEAYSHLWGGADLNH